MLMTRRMTSEARSLCDESKFNVPAKIQDNNAACNGLLAGKCMNLVICLWQMLLRSVGLNSSPGIEVHIDLHETLTS